MPCGFVRPHVARSGSTLYVGGGSTGKVETSRTVYKYCMIKDSWSSLPIAPYYTFALAVVKGYVTGWLLIPSIFSHLYYAEHKITTTRCSDIVPDQLQF